MYIYFFLSRKDNADNARTKNFFLLLAPLLRQCASFGVPYYIHIFKIPDRQKILAKAKEIYINIEQIRLVSLNNFFAFLSLVYNRSIMAIGICFEREMKSIRNFFH